MRALVKTAPGPGNLELRDVPVPEIGGDEILMRVTHCGICGSDLHMETAVHPCEPPVILGHEYTGVVAKAGASVTQFEEGDAVSYWHGPMPFPGVRADGGFAEYMRLPARCMWKTPEGIGPEEASQFETVIVPFRLVRDAVGVQPGERVVVSGPGEVGLLCANLAKIDGASHVTVLGAPDDETVRLPKALEMGADEAAVLDDESLSKLRGDSAPSCWIEASGAAPAIEAAVDCIARSGRVSLSGLGTGPWNVNMNKVSYENIRLLGCWGGAQEYMEEAADLMRSGKLKVAATISAVMPLTQWQEAFAMLRRKEAVKILLDPSH